MSAVNSYTLLDLSDEIIEQKPDAVLIYAGHNEFLGILGVGSNYTAMGSETSTRWFLSLKHFRVFQLIQTLYFNFAVLNNSNANNPTDGIARDNTDALGQQSRTFMAKVAKNKAIAKGSEVYQTGLNQFENNMSVLLKKYQDAGIQVYISTIASNHSGQKPFSSLPIEDKFNTAANALFRSSQTKRQQEENLEEASIALRNSQSAALHFQIGQLALQLQNTDIARVHFSLAVEHDQLRFRAPAAMNEIIRSLASQYNAILVDAEKALATRSPNGIIGNSMMLEHLHPNLQGYFVISNAFYESLATHLTSKPFVEVSIARAWAERLVLPQEEYYGFATILNLSSDYPFTDTPTKPTLPKPADWQQQLGQDFFAKRITWLQMMEVSLNRYKAENNQVMMAKVIQILADALPHNGLYNLQIAEIKFKKKRLNESLFYYRRAKLAGAIGHAVDNNIKLIENALGLMPN